MRRLARAAAVAALLAVQPAIAADSKTGGPGQSPFGPSDEIGMLNLMTDASRLAILSRVSSGRVYDLSVDYKVGMASWTALGEPAYQIWNIHTPRGTVVDNPTNTTREANELVTYSGEAISMYVHTGTHIDTLNHFGIRGAIWNGFTADEHLGDRGWRKAGAETIPPMIARGVLIDVAAAKGVAVLPPSYGITAADLEEALRRQGTRVQKGDVVMVRTGRMALFHDNTAYLTRTPGLTRESAKYLADAGAIVVGADNISTDVSPSQEPDNWIPVHSYLLTERGVNTMQSVYLEDLARDKVYEFAWIGAPLKLAGASGAPMRPIALPVR